jgi:hypothetical protein
MLESVDVGKRSVADYEATAGREAVERLRALAEPLRGAHVLHLWLLRPADVGGQRLL